MPDLQPRPWWPERSQALMRRWADTVASGASPVLTDRLGALADRSRDIHERECFNLNPAANVMNPRAEALLASGLGMRPSLGYPGEKYETGLEAIEEIEGLATALASEVFGAGFVELRVPSGAMANLYGFMALARPGDAIIVPPASIAGHVTHHAPGCAGLFGLRIFEAPVDAARYTLDVGGLRILAEKVRPALITVGGSLNLWPHDVAAVRTIADEFGAKVLFDAAHQCGMIAGGLWPDPLSQGAHVMTMSTYKSLGGPPSGLVLTNDAAIAERLDAIAFPGMTANFDVSKTAALAISLLDWRDFGPAYARTMADTALALAEALAAEGLSVHGASGRYTASHQLAIEAAEFGGGQRAAQALRKAGVLASGIGLPITPVPGDMNGLRLGTPEIVRWGMTPDDMPRLAELIGKALRSTTPEALAPEVADWRKSFDRLHFMHL